MYINYLNDRTELGFACLKDHKVGNAIYNLEILFNPIKQSNNICILVFSKETFVAILLFFNMDSIDSNLSPYQVQPSKMKIYRSDVRKSTNLKSSESTNKISDFILTLNGGDDALNDKDQERLIASVLAKIPETTYKELSINKFLKKLVTFLDPIVTNKGVWRILSELEKPAEPTISDRFGLSGSTKSSSTSSMYAEALVLPEQLSQMQRRVLINKALNKPRISTMLPAATNPPTAELFSADSRTGEIQDMNVAFMHFKERMTEIGNQYTGEKKIYFFEQLDQCDMDRFSGLCHEQGRATFNTAREAETALQCEFERIHEPQSSRRPTEEEARLGNVLDGFFTKGIINGDSMTLNEDYTHYDLKGFVSDHTSQVQAEARRLAGQRNSEPDSMFEQGRKAGLKLVAQKHKHCKPDVPALPASSRNVKHILNTIELSMDETARLKEGVLDGTRTAWAEKLGVDKSEVSDEIALQGVIYLNEEYTIPRVL